MQKDHVHKFRCSLCQLPLSFIERNSLTCDSHAGARPHDALARAHAPTPSSPTQLLPPSLRKLPGDPAPAPEDDDDGGDEDGADGGSDEVGRFLRLLLLLNLSPPEMKTMAKTMAPVARFPASLSPFFFSNSDEYRRGRPRVAGRPGGGDGGWGRFRGLGGGSGG